MTTAATLLPMLGPRIEAGPVELRGITDDLLGQLADLAAAGILLLERENFVRFEHELTVHGVCEFRRSIGLGG